MSKHKKELRLLAVLFALALALIFGAFGRTDPYGGFELLEKLALAILVVIVSRLATLLVFTHEAKDDVFRSSRAEYENALASARTSIWICQTWLPGLALYADLILRKKRSLRILLASFKPGSAVYSRVLGRPDIPDAKTAMTLVASSVSPFVLADLKECLRFNFGHYPGWITVVDDDIVFWGPTPVEMDNNARDHLFHKDAVSGEKGAFWKSQFELLWDRFGLAYDEERKNNAALP